MKKIILIYVSQTDLSFSARDTVRPVREIHSATPVWPGADYTLPMVLGSADREAGPAGGHTSPPGSLAIAGPNEDDAGGNADASPRASPADTR